MRIDFSKVEGHNTAEFQSLVLRFNKLLSYVKTREKEVEEFLNYVAKNFSYFTCPASTRYHSSHKYGLFIHSMNVAEIALTLNKSLNAQQSEESIVICALFHDFGKAGNPDNPQYIERKPTEKQIQYGYSAYPPYDYNTDIEPFMTVPQRSIYWVSRFMVLTQVEYVSILIHDGQYVPENKPYALKEPTLARLIQMADNWSLEVEKGTEAKQTKSK